MVLTAIRNLSVVLFLFSLPLQGFCAQPSPQLRAVVAVATNYSGSFQPAPGLAAAIPIMDTAIRGFANRAGFANDAVHIEFLVDIDVANYPSKVSSDGMIVTALANMARQSAPGDTLIFFFTGHGTTEAEGKMMLHTSASNGIDPANRIDLDTQVLKVIQRHSKASRNLVFVDSCQSTGLAGALSMDKPLLTQRSQVESLKTPGVFTLLASDVNELAHVDEKRGVGFFTSALANRLTDDQIRTASELAEAVASDVHEVVLQRKQLTQRPVPSLYSAAGEYTLFPKREVVSATTSPRIALQPTLALSRLADFSSSQCLPNGERRDLAVFTDTVTVFPKTALLKGDFYQLRTGFTSPASVKVFVGPPISRTEIFPSTSICEECAKGEKYFDVPVSGDGEVNYVMRIENGHSRTTDVSMNFQTPFELNDVKAAMTVPSGVELDTHYSPGTLDHECMGSNKTVLQCYGAKIGAIRWTWNWSLWNECTDGKKWPPERAIPGDTAWIFLGYFNTKSGKYSEGPYAEVIGDIEEQSFVLGTKIKLLAERQTYIVDYKKTSTQKKLVSPISVGIVRDQDIVGLVLSRGTKLTVRDVSRGSAPNRDQAVWLRVIRTPN